MSHFDDSVDWNHPALTQYSQPSSSSRPRLAPNLSAARPVTGSARNGMTAHPPPTATSNGNQAQSSSSSSSRGLGWMSGMNNIPRHNPPSSNPRPQGGSLPPKPDWLSRAYDAPRTSPLATHQQQLPNRPSNNYSSQPIQPPVRVPSTSNSSSAPSSSSSSSSGLSWTNGARSNNYPNSTNGRSYPSQSSSHANPPRQSWSNPRPVAFPSGFNPNASPSPQYLHPPPPPPPSQPAPARVAFYAPESDVPKGRKPRSSPTPDLGRALPAHLQQYVHLTRSKLPGHLDEEERKLLRAERRRLKTFEKSSAKEQADSKKERERIDLDIFHTEQSRERGGWNAYRIKVCFQLCSDDRIAVETTPKGELTVLHTIQSIEGAKFDRTLTSLQTTSASSRARQQRNEAGGSKGLWTIPISAYDACLARCIGLRTESREIVIVPVDTKHLRALRGDSASAALTKHQMKFESMQGIPNELAKNLYPFQKEGVEYCVAHNGRALIGDEMGLGKSIQSLAVAAYYQDDWPLLIVCPSSVRLTWRNELLKWLGVASLRESDITTLSSDSEPEQDADGEGEDDGFVDNADDGEEEYQPKPLEKYQDDFIEDDEEFERILKATVTKDSAAAAAANSKRPLTLEEKADAFLNANSHAIDDGEAEYGDELPSKMKRGGGGRKGTSSSTSKTKPKPKPKSKPSSTSSRKRKRGYRTESDSEEYEDADYESDFVVDDSEEEDEDDDEEWSAEQERADRKRAGRSAKDEEEDKEEDEDDDDDDDVPIKKKSNAKKRRRIISDDDDDDNDDDGSYGSTPAISSSPIEIDGSENVRISPSDDEDASMLVSPSKPSSSPAAPSSSSSSASASATQRLSAKEQFRARAGAALGIQSPSTSPAVNTTTNDMKPSKSPHSLSSTFHHMSVVKSEPSPSTGGEGDNDSLDPELQDALRQVAEFEASEKLQRDMSTVPSSTSVKAEPSSMAPTTKVKSEPSHDIVDLVEDSPEPIKPYVSASTFIRSVDELDAVKQESNLKPEPTVKKHEPQVKQESQPQPSSKPSTLAASPSLAPTKKSPSPNPFAKSTSSSPEFPPFEPPVKAPARPAFKPLFKNEINVILNGKQALLPGGPLRTRVVIISYDLLIKYTLQLQREKFNFIIADESHYVKNGTAKRSLALLPLMEQAKRVVCLSGTPAMSRPYELYPQINAICPGVFGSAHQFGARYCAPTKGFRGQVEYKGANNLVELHMLLKKYCLIRRLKQDVLKDLRPKTRTVIMTSVHDKGMMDTMKRHTNMKDAIAAEVNGPNTNTPGTNGTPYKISAGAKLALMEVYAKTGIAKLPFIISYITDLIENGTKFLIFAHHLNVLDGIEEFLRKHKTGYFRLDGSTNATDRQAGVERFQTDRWETIRHEQELSSA